MNVNEYIFMPERVDMMVKDGRLSCVLNTNGKVDFIYHKDGITEVRSGLRKSPFTSFRNELHYGVYDDVVDEVIESVEKSLVISQNILTLPQIIPKSIISRSLKFLFIMKNGLCSRLIRFLLIFDLVYNSLFGH